MRATAYNGRKARVVDLPQWVALGAQLVARCDRCSLDVDLSHLTRADAERALGRFALWHRRCPDRSAFPASTEWSDEEDEPMRFTIVRKEEE